MTPPLTDAASVEIQTIRLRAYGDAIITRVFLGFETIGKRHPQRRVVVCTREEYDQAQNEGRLPRTLSFRMSDVVRDDTASWLNDESVEHAWDTVPVPILIDVDRQIAPLVAALQTIPRMRTYASCAGHLMSQGERRAHVSLGYCATMLDPGPGRRFFERMRTYLVEQGTAVELTISDDTADLYLPRDQIGTVATILTGQRFDDDSGLPSGYSVDEVTP